VAGIQSFLSRNVDPQARLYTFCRGLFVRFRFGFLLPLGLAAMVGWEAGAAIDKEAYNLQEVFDLLKANLAGVTAEQLNEAAVRGLLDQLAGKVSVAGEPSSTAAAGATNALVSATVYETHYGYLRVSRLATGAGSEFQNAYERLRATNSFKGLIVDLRFAVGQDYAAAMALADQFFSEPQPLADWGEGWKKSTAKTNAISLPVAVLVNRKTSGAAEALAGILRHSGVGLLIGTNTAGQASMAKEFTLKTGQRLRLAVAPLKVADGKQLPFTGIKADIEVVVSPDDELAWYHDPYRPAPGMARLTALATNETAGASTNRSSRRRVNEAELVRMNREGQLPDRDSSFTNTSGRTPEPMVQTVNDPVLSRALDLLKGLAVVQQFRPQ
jgi:hypothetical protein